MDPRIDEHSCLEVVQATPDPGVNWATIGLPRHVAPEECRDRPAELAANSQRTVLTIRQEADADFVVDAVTCHLWLIGGSSPTRTLTRVPADGAAASGTPAPVFLRFVTTHGAPSRELQTRDHHWANLAGNGRLPGWLGIPQILPAGTSYAIEVDNSHSTNAYAINVGLWGRYVAATHGPDHRGSAGMRRAIAANPTRVQTSRRLAELAAAGALDRRQVQDNNRHNFTGVGVPLLLPLPSAPITPATGNYDSPGTVTNTRVRIDEASRFFCRHIMGMQLVSGQAEADAEMARPVFVRIFNKRAGSWLTNGFVPMDAVCGTGEYPMVLPVDWVWGPHADVNVELKSCDGSSVACDITFEGFLADCA